MPPEMTIVIASWLFKLVEMSSLSGTIMQKPLVGLGVVGINTV